MKGRRALKRWQKILLIIVILFICLLGFAFWYLATRDQREPSMLAFRENCASCHGVDLSGGNAVPALVGRPLTHGETWQDLLATISGHSDFAAAHAWHGRLSPETRKGIALYISERRQKFVTTAASYHFMPTKDEQISSQYYDFKLEHVTALVSRPYSIAPLPDGQILVAEKIRGLSLIDTQGRQGALIEATPRVWDTLFSVQGSWLNLGIVLDVALHPNYTENGWVYLSHTDRCWFDCGSLLPATMVRVVRGRIEQGRWRDEQIIWSVHHDHYTPVPDGVAAGRLAFDRDGHIYISIGGKNTYDKLHDLDTPFGKIHRARDDGTVPEDNPYFVPEAKRNHASTRHTVWSIGHRTGQGLDGHPESGEIWNTEMGPRGGDEINKIMRGGNYGWPLYTTGLNYNGARIMIGEDLGLDFPLADTILPVVDLTPAPAVSNFTFYQGDAFENWVDDLLVGSLKAGTLYRIRIKDGKRGEQEKLLSNFGRIRDVAIGAGGTVYIALEHGEAGSLWRLVRD